MTPRRSLKLPIVLSADEVKRLLLAAPSLRDKLLLGLMYATGISEVSRLRLRDIDFERWRTPRSWRTSTRFDGGAWVGGTSNEAGEAWMN